MFRILCRSLAFCGDGRPLPLVTEMGHPKLRVSTRLGAARPIVLLALIAVGSVAVWYSQGRPEEKVAASEYVSELNPAAIGESGIQPVAAPQNGDTTGAGQNKNPEPEQASIDEMLKFAQAMRDRIRADVKDYTAILVKRERIGGKLYEEARMEVKIRNAVKEQYGLSAYFHFVAPQSTKGREVIWVEGGNDGKLLAHDAGFKRMLGTLNLDPDGRLAMMGQKYPIYEVGLLRLVEKLIEKGQTPPLQNQATITIDENKVVDGHQCRMIQVTLPKQGDGVDFHVARIYVDLQRMVPLRYAAYLWPDAPGGELPLEEEYTYLNLELNVGLKDVDFDPTNPKYDFP